MKVERIAVGITPNHNSDSALRRAMALGRAFDAKVDVVNGVGVGHLRRGAGQAAVWASHVAASEAQAREACRGKLELLVEDSNYAEEDLDSYLHIRPEKGGAALLAHAKEHASDLLVIGEHRRRGLFDFGGTARGVLAAAECPIWVQPNGSEPGLLPPIKSIVAPVDLSKATGSVLRAAGELARRFDAPLEVLHVFVPPTFAYDLETGVAAGPTFVIDSVRDGEREQLDECVAAIEWKGLKPNVVQAEGDATQVIEEKAEDPTTLVVMGSHGHSGLARAILGSVAYAVVKSRRGPTLVIPQDSEVLLNEGVS